ncbi:MAG: methyltransferase domain-containing protein [Candidatus Omnitrophica bacterium]|nr:methyltransferase domain-containing protein [Candidatus Omnitrophota bacterium]
MTELVSSNRWRYAVWAVLAAGGALLALGWLDLFGWIARHLSPDGVLQSETLSEIRRFNQATPVVGGALVGAALAAAAMRDRLQAWLRAFDVPEAVTAESPALQLFLVSVIGLFLQMLIIRWVSSEVRIFAYFKNLALLGCFFGFGLGTGLGRRRISLLLIFLPLLALALYVQFPEYLGPLSLPNLIRFVGSFDDLRYWVSAPRKALLWSAGLIQIAAIFLTVLLPFIPIGQWLGRLLSTAPPLRAYTINLLGSLAGIWLFSGLSWAWLPPVAWFVLALAGLLVLLRRHRAGWAGTLVFGLALLAVLGLPREGLRVVWSPYHQLLVHPVPAGEGSGRVQHIIEVNHTFYQNVEDTRRPAPVALSHYEVPYRIVPQPGRVLIVGAGSGNDVAAALRAGAGHVTAVEIDPAIAALGRELHPEHPYDSPRVRLVIDDARAYFKRAGERYDLIVFGMLDSHTLSSTVTNIRLDHYVYTVESLREARRLLGPEGVLVLTFAPGIPWMHDRLAETLQQVFDQPPLLIGPTLIAGDPSQIQAALARDPQLAQEVRPHASHPAIRVTTDDWPYLYLPRRGIPLLQLAITGLVGLLFWLIARRSLGSMARLDGQFFFLGAAFLLIEFQGVSRAALLFGTTWLVNAIMISGILLMALASTGFVARRRIVSTQPFYAGLLLCVLLGALLPLEHLAGGGLWSRAIGPVALQTAPLFFSGVIFAAAFRQARDVRAAFSSNLLGAVAGGLVESVSYLTGIRALSWVILLFYALAWVSGERATAHG